jgi:putative acetyltransferase
MANSPAEATLVTPRLRLVPQAAVHAEAMFEVLSDPRIYEHENEPPASVAALRERYARLESRRSSDGSEQWLNWVVEGPGRGLIGFVQATVTAGGTTWIAYEFASRHWGRGYASEAVAAMIDHLGARHGATTLRAVLKRSNARSMRLLRGLGFEPIEAPAGSIEADEVLTARAVAPRFAIAPEPPRQPEVIALIDELDAYQRPLYPPESHHGIDLDALEAPGVAFVVVRDRGRAVGCGAVVCAGADAELKRMFVRPALRGRGLAAALLRHLIDEAAVRGCRRLWLETGIHQHEAIALYRRAGFVDCPPFGSYRPDPNSVFMTRSIEDQT